MVKITGSLHINTGFIRIKPNINFIGSVQGTKIYNLSEPLELELPPTPAPTTPPTIVAPELPPDTL